ncbi:diguanylate cyclase [Actinoplanes sp. CA-015351]|uniref:diguanylate cyclase n=1 Tax=Actinoplanes sp. CA-015351 TaxID=3239897 RepID=UPI003D977053
MPTREAGTDVGGGGAVPVRLSSAAVLRAVLAAMVVAGLGYLTGNAAVHQALPLLSDIAAAVAVLAVLRWYRGTYRPVWLLIGPGIVLLGSVHLLWFVRVGLGGASTADTAGTGLIQVIAWIFMISGCVSELRHRAAGAAGGVVEAALIGMGLTTPLWEFLLRPALLRLDTPAVGQILCLLPVYCIAAIMGGLVRLFPHAETARNTLLYMFAALGLSLTGLTVAVTRTDPVTGGQPAWVVLFFVAAMLCLAGAALDPGNNELGRVPQNAGQGTVRLPYLGVGLLLGPVVGGVPQLFGMAPDGVMLCAGQAVMTVLVLVRLNQSERDRAAQQRLLVEQAQHDELTGLPNRRHLFELLTAVEGAGGVAVLFCDLNDFKPINDTLGHEAGDSVLRTAAARLRGAVRGEDVVGRVGGDEFLVICPGADDAGAAEIRDRIVAGLSEPIAWSGHVLRVGVSIGVAVSEAGESSDALVARADALMYAAKRAGKAGAPEQQRSRAAR